MLIRQLLPALLLTVFLEGLTVLALVRDRKWLPPSVLGNVCTNPLLNLLVTYAVSRGAAGAGYVLLVLFLEAAAVLYEAYIYYSLTDAEKREAILVSLAANAVSFLTGLIIL